MDKRINYLRKAQAKVFIALSKSPQSQGKLSQRRWKKERGAKKALDMVQMYLAVALDLIS